MSTSDSATTPLPPVDRSRAASRALVGMAAPAVTIETHLPGGLPAFTLVGLPEAAVREARDRVKSAIQNCGLDFPQGRVVVNLAPADLVKEGGRFDLAIAISILAATGQVPHDTASRYEFLGELGLFGEVRGVRGCLCAALANRQDGGTRPLLIPAANGTEARLAPDTGMIPVEHLTEVIALLRDGRLPNGEHPPVQPARAAMSDGHDRAAATLDQVIGQESAKRAITIAAAGGHHLLMVGPPGTGKTLLAKRLAGLLPRLDAIEAMEVAAVYSAAGLAPPEHGHAPFREPHHSATAPALVGGGQRAMPGEISLAHRGVLFLDELPHFKPSVLDLLREPLESQSIAVARAGYRARFPAAFQLIAAMNPCPAGRICSRETCRCTPDRVHRYQARISGPLLDRIDLQVAVQPVPQKLLLTGEVAAPTGEHEVATAAVAAARQQQRARQGCLNGLLAGADLRERIELGRAERELLARAGERFRLSARSIHRVMRVARTIADLANESQVHGPHLAEALGYRSLDWDHGLGMAAG